MMFLDVPIVMRLLRAGEVLVCASLLIRATNVLRCDLSACMIKHVATLSHTNKQLMSTLVPALVMGSLRRSFLAQTCLLSLIFEWRQLLSVHIDCRIFTLNQIVTSTNARHERRLHHILLCVVMSCEG